MEFFKNCLYFEKETIASYLVEKKKNGTLNLKSKDYELMVALFLRELYEKKLGFTGAIIGLPLKDERANDFPKHGMFGVDELEKILASKQVFDESSDVDVVIGRMTGGEIDKQAAPYQLKRFGLGDETGGGTKEFIKFLGRYDNYSPTKTRLFVLIEVGTKEIDTADVVEWLKSRKYPFKEVGVVFMADDMIHFVQLFPNPSSTNFPLKEIVV